MRFPFVLLLTLAVPVTVRAGAPPPKHRARPAATNPLAAAGGVARYVPVDPPSGGLHPEPVAEPGEKSPSGVVKPPAASERL
jgi:hypothetical protein